MNGGFLARTILRNHSFLSVSVSCLSVPFKQCLEAQKVTVSRQLSRRSSNNESVWEQVGDRDAPGRAGAPAGNALLPPRPAPLGL